MLVDGAISPVASLLADPGTRLLDCGWIERTAASRAVEIALAGRRGLHRTLGIVG